MLKITTMIKHGLLTALALCAGAAFGFAQPQSGVRGEFDPETEIVTDENGYCYKYVDGMKLELCAGGRYAGTVTLPKTLIVGGKELEVAGIGANAFRDNKDVKEVNYDRDGQYVGPSAFYRSGIRYGWGWSFDIPSYGYPDEAFGLIVRPSVPEYPSFERDRWFQFKHNVAPLSFVKDRSKDESALWGYSPWRADQMQGAYYELDASATQKKDMFRGYEAMEVIGLVAESRFIAQHRFPPFSRWKWGEPEQSMGAAMEKAMETRYGRTLRVSHYIGNLREEDGRLGIFEFEPRDGEAMIVIAWTQGGKVRATYVQTTEVDPEDGMGSLWNVDDDGSYGIPNLLCVAFDAHDNVILFLEHGAPESRNMYGLRQQGDQLQLFGEDQWYVRVD